MITLKNSIQSSIIHQPAPTVEGVVLASRILTEGGDGILLETGDDLLTE